MKFSKSEYNINKPTDIYKALYNFETTLIRVVSSCMSMKLVDSEVGLETGKSVIRTMTKAISEQSYIVKDIDENFFEIEMRLP